MDDELSSSATADVGGVGGGSGNLHLGRVPGGLTPPPAIARVSPGNIRSLILEKEKELHDINEYRIRTLETLLREKETAATAYKQKFVKLQEDFKYNLKLLEGRDEELALYDTNFATLKGLVRDREAEISELKAQLADRAAEATQEHKRAAEQEAYYQQKLKDARAQMEGARWTFDDELRRTRDEMEQAKRKMERQLREQQEDLETQRREITITFDDVMRQRELEFKQTLEEAHAKNRELELKVKSTHREAEMAKERCEELKTKLENTQQILGESEKEVKSLEWQLSDHRAIKDAKIAELEDEILKLQEVKQSLLDEYEEKMAELLQSLHSVEKAFVQQKAQYEEELQRQIRKKDEDAQNLALRLDGKAQSLMGKLRDSEEQREKLQAELKQMKWDAEDNVMEKDREIERMRQEVQDIEDQKQSVIGEMKQQIWTLERENMGLQEKLKDITTQSQVQKEKDKIQRQELNDALEKQEDLKREVVTLNLRWENKWQDKEQELTSRYETRIRELQQARDRLLSEKQATEDRLVHSENELHRLRSELLMLKSDARAVETFGPIAFSNKNEGQYVRQSADRESREGSLPAPSPLWSDDNGTLSPVAGVSPLLTESPQRGSTDRVQAALQEENTKLKDLIRQMKEALTKQANEMSANTPVGNDSDVDVTAKLALAEKQCLLLEAQLHEVESKLKAASVNDAIVKETNDKLVLCQAQLIQANHTIDEKNKVIANLESQLSNSQAIGTTGPVLSASQVVADAQLSDLNRQLASAHNDIERLVKERTQLMEMSNQLTAELRRLKEAPVGGTGKSIDFAGKKDYENMIAELSRSLEESRLHNKTLKKEVRRLLKAQALSNGDPDGGRSRASSVVAAELGDNALSDRRRPSTLSMMRQLDHSESKRSSMVSNTSGAPSTLFDEELLSLVRNKVPSPSATSRSLSLASRAGKRQSAVIPQSIPEHDAEDDEERAEEDQGYNVNDQGGAQSQSEDPAPTPKDAKSQSSMSMLFSRDRLDSTASNESSAKVSDARLRLQQAKEMLLLAGKKAERSSSLASLGAQVPIKLSDRQTPSQRSAIKKLKDLQAKRAEMVNERKKVRNYSMAT